MKIFFLIFLSSTVVILSKLDEMSIFKALVCVNIVTTKKQKEEIEANILSPMILTCYMKIREEQVLKLTEGLEKGSDISLSDNEIEDLIDMESLKELPENEVRKKGEELEEAIKEFQKMQGIYDENGEHEDYDDGYDDGDDDYDYEDFGEGKKNNMTKKGFFRLIKKGIISFGEILISSWCIIGILLLFYLLLLEIRRNNDGNNNSSNDKEEKEKEKKENKKEENINKENINKDKNKDDEKEENENKEEKKIENERKIEEEKENKKIEENKENENKKEKQD